MREAAHSFWRDVRHAIRFFLRNPRGPLTIVFSIGLAVGITTAVFSFFDAVLLRPLPYGQSERLVLLWASKTKEVKRGISGPDLEDLKSQNAAFEDLVPIIPGAVPLSLKDAEDREVACLYVGENLFPLLGVRPYAGHLSFSTGEQAQGRQGAVLSYSFWRRQFGEDRSVIGGSIVLGGQLFTIIGVTAPDFFFPDQTIQVWLPIRPEMLPSNRNVPIVQAIGRLKSGVSIRQAQTNVDLVVDRLVPAARRTDKTLSVGVFALTENIIGAYWEAFWWLAGAMTFLLLIACANVAHLLIIQGARRNIEISIRAALGATRLSILRQLLTESLLLSQAAGILGIFVAFVGIHILARLDISEIPRFDEARLDLKCLFFAIVVSQLTGLLFGLLPAITGARSGYINPARSGGAGFQSGIPGKVRDFLTVGEVALAFVLLVYAGLLANSFVRLIRINWGFEPHQVLIADVRPPRTDWLSIPQNTAYANQMLLRLKALPGVLSVAVARGSPITGVTGGPIGVTPDGSAWENPRLEIVGANYFRTLGVQIRQGREFTERDDAAAPRVVVIDSNLAEELWPGVDPIGKMLGVSALSREAATEAAQFARLGKVDDMRRVWQNPDSRELVHFEVVGVVSPVLMLGPLHSDSTSVYVDYRQRPPGIPMFTQSFFLKTSLEPASLTKSVREAIKDVGGVRIDSIDTLEQRVNAAVGGRGSNKLLIVVSSLTGTLGLLFSALGIYGTVAYATVLRTNEIGVRMALGAQRKAIFLMIIGRGLMLAIAGLLLGLLGAILTTKILANQLFAISPTDPMTFIGAGFVFLFSAFLASYWPARRAMQLDPVAALRYE